MKRCLCCNESGFGKTLLSITVLVYKPDDSQQRLRRDGKVTYGSPRKMLNSQSFHVCVECCSKWDFKKPVPRLRCAFRDALSGVLKRLETGIKRLPD